MPTINRVEPRVCPSVEHAFAVVGKKWTGLIVHVLGGGPTRFSDLLNEVPQLSSRLLSSRLKELEAEGIVQREVIPDKPVRVEYSLTDKGKKLIPIMRSIAEWAHQ